MNDTVKSAWQDLNMSRDVKNEHGKAEPAILLHMRQTKIRRFKHEYAGCSVRLMSFHFKTSGSFFPLCRLGGFGSKMSRRFHITFRILAMDLGQRHLFGFR